MNSKDILFALQNREISLEAAEKELAKIKDHLTNPYENNSMPKGIEAGGQSVVDLCEVSPGIAQITMHDKVNKNTFSIELVTGLMQAFEAVKTDSKYKAVILTGYDNYFACGGNREGMQAIHEGKIKLTDINVYRIPLDCGIPVIAAMQGHAIGSGWCMGLFSDFVIMSRESYYACNHMKYGFTPGDGATLIFPEKLGANLSQEILFLGKKFRGNELERKGIPLPVLPRGEVLPYALKLAKNLVNTPRESLVLLKSHMTDSIRKRLPGVIESEWKMQQKTFLNKPEVFDKLMSAFDQLPNQQNQLSESGPGTGLAQKKTPYDQSAVQKKRKPRPEYPELIQLNHVQNGRPVFWIHGDGGGLGGYQAIAEQCARPFYGIQARGWMSNETPLRGMQAMASYYVGIIRSIQSDGPYDLGGYSLGGTLAYEVARLLQELGQTVHTIVMINTLDSMTMNRTAFSQKTKILQAVNLSLLFRLRQEPEKLVSKLIRNDELDPEMSSEDTLRSLISIGKTRGLSLKKSDRELFRIFSDILRVQNAFEEEEFKALPLPDPAHIACHYFLNETNSFFGGLKPYLVEQNQEIHDVPDGYWRDWKRLIPDFHLTGIHAESHMTLLFEAEICKNIADYCEKLYSDGIID